MNKIDFKIAIRAFLKGKWYNFLNIAGLAMGLAAFIFVTLYVNNETGYDSWNKKADRVFLIEREMPNGPMPYTPGKLAAAIKNQCAEVEETGRMNTALFQMPFFTASGKLLIKKWVGADYSVAAMLGIKPKGFILKPIGNAPTILLSKQTAAILFPGKNNIQNETVHMMSKTGMPIAVAGVADDVPGNTSIQFDCIGFSNDITQGKDQSYANQIYQTYLLVKPNTNIYQLSKKIDKIYRNEVMADTSRVAKQALTQTALSTIYLDPLRNLHLKPHYSTQVNNQIVNGLVALAIIILIVTGVNFTNLYISQANGRSKEVGIKKVNGTVKAQIIIQFLIEIFCQCLLALLFAFILVAIGLPYFNNLLGVNLIISGINFKIILQLFTALTALTLLAGVYPALVMAGFKPIEVLRGSTFSSGGKLSWIQQGITVVQFTFAIGFIIVLIVANKQVNFMKSENPGFVAKQVLYIDNMGIYNNPKKFESVSNGIQAIPGVKNVTVASNVPGGIIPASFEYEFQSKAYALQTIAVGYNYFETLSIKLREGHYFSPVFPDSANAVINETAAKAMGLKQPVGSVIKGRGCNYTITGVVKDVKANGYETGIQPTIYLMHNNNGLLKTQIMICAKSNAMPTVIDALNSQWPQINKLDGDNFNYHFLDDLYGQLFIKQEQLKSVLACFSALALFIASLGLFASVAQSIKVRTKEIAVRKVFGAKGRQLMLTLGKPFIGIVVLANLVAWPIAFIISSKWLNTFAYRIAISTTPFAVALIISIIIAAVTVCVQILRAVKFNPATKLKI